ncbi:MAG: FKBP-type peptidyl-prolyl cis-trans isomerase [Bacteroidales bacterium]|nr:FKBP-type peptidyl-prolyl cis-trans isomerase [Candidatus Cacconaster merdequi]
MKKILSIAAICVLGVIASCSCSRMTSDEKQPEGISKADVDSASFMLGYSFGMNLAQSNFGALNMDKMCEGIKAAIGGEEVPQDEFYRVLNGFMEKRMELLKEKTVAESAAFLEKNTTAEGVVTTESGLQYQIVRAGNGVFPTSDKDTVEVNYEGSTIAGKVFDSSYERGTTAKFPLNQVIKGWSEGIMHADEGSEINLWIPADLAYGDNGAGADILPGAAIKFKVELISVKPFVETAEEGK